MKATRIGICLSTSLCLATLAMPVMSQAQVAKQTYDAVRDSNKTNAVGGVFTYGVGGFPGQFDLMTRVVADCESKNGVVCISNLGEQPYVSGVTINGSGALHSVFSILQPPHLLRLDPQLTPGTIVRFTVPQTGSYDIEGWFESIDTVAHSTAMLVFAGGTQIFYDILLRGGFGDQKPFAATALALNQGDTIDFIVKTNSNCCFLSIGLAARISRTINASTVSQQTQVRSTGVIYSRATQRFQTTIRVTNRGDYAIAGPIHVVFKGLPSGVTLVNRTGWIDSDPYLTLPNTTTLQPGATATAVVQFSNPSVSFINFTAEVYAGEL